MTLNKFALMRIAELQRDADCAPSSRERQRANDQANAILKLLSDHEESKA